MAAIGIIANPAAGSDVRRLASPAPFRTEAGIIAMVTAVAAGAAEAGVELIRYMPDRRGVVARALVAAGVIAEPVECPRTGTRIDTQRAAAAMARLDVGAVVVLGGDGTNRDVAMHWRDAPVVALSSGTNNVFPSHWEPTAAGFAGGLVATGAVPLVAVARRALVAEVGEHLALVDLALLDGGFTGSRAVLSTRALRELVITIAEPGRVGLSAIGAVTRPSPRDVDGATHLRLAQFPHAKRWVRAAVLPGRYDDIGILDEQTLDVGDTIVLRGPGVLAFDGERDVVLDDDAGAEVSIRRDGPWVIDVMAAVALPHVQRATGGRCAV